MNNIITDNEFKSLIPPLSEEEYNGLEKSIVEEGCRDFLVVWNNTLIDGHNRLKICEKNNVDYQTINKEFSNREEAKLWIIRNQLNRRNLKTAARIELALELEKILKPLAKKQQGEGGGAVPQKSAKPPIDVRKEVAKAAEVSTDTVAKYKVIKKEATPEIIEKLKRGDPGLSINSVYNSVKQQMKKIPSPAPPLPTNIYDVILADPPWEYKNFSTGIAGSASSQYPTMSISDICELPIKKLTAKNTVLFLWVTNPLLEESFSVIKAWGFNYKTNICWNKINRKTGGGFYVRGIHELLLICTKGSILPTMTPVSLLNADATGHSKKPQEIYNIIEKMYPNGKYLEIFARNKKENWTSWGNEI